MSKSDLLNRPMKFWEVLSVFRANESVLVTVFSHTDWRSPFLEWYERRNSIVDKQNRDILDLPVPLKLTRQIVKQIPSLYYFDTESRNLRADRLGMSNPLTVKEMTSLEVHDEFGGALIEEVQEYGSVMVPKTG